ncbi:hypothetical protein KUV23_03025 [Algoriphagus marincola]|uniref:Membrane protein involved in the export of O-antigen and teichoic acid n=1 Tax=Algoriphagus marincola TaxID=264027 RepID=A0ABS7N1Y8_9BACT|nr:hypothetical protein [Algoriphagus marincola]MBY5949928.1 hypothetical protein [Algoriphagus marincola]
MKSKLFRKLNRYLLKKFSKNNVKYFYDLFFFGIGFFVSSLIALYISIIVNKNLPNVELGIFNYNKSLLEFLSYTFTLVMYRSYLRFNINGVNISVKQKVQKLSTLAFAGIALVAFYLTDSFFAVVFAFFIFFEERLYFFRSLMQVAKINFLKIGSASLTLLLLYGFITVDLVKPELILFAYGLGFLLSIFFLKSKGSKTNFEEISWNTVLLYTFPMLGSIIVKLSLDLVSQYLIKINFDPIELSKYAIAVRVLLSVKVFSNLFMMFFPVIYFREVKKKNASFIRKLRIFVIGSMLIIVIFASFINEFVYNLMGASKYIEYTYMYSILVFSELIFVIGGVYGVFLAYALKTHYSLMIYTVGAAVNIVLLNLFLKSYGIIIAPLSILVANILMTTLFFIVSYRMENKYLKSTE